MSVKSYIDSASVSPILSSKKSAMSNVHQLLGQSSAILSPSPRSKTPFSPISPTFGANSTVYAPVDAASMLSDSIRNPAKSGGQRMISASRNIVDSAVIGKATGTAAGAFVVGAAEAASATSSFASALGSRASPVAAGVTGGRIGVYGSPTLMKTSLVGTGGVTKNSVNGLAESVTMGGKNLIVSPSRVNDNLAMALAQSREALSKVINTSSTSLSGTIETRKTVVRTPAPVVAPVGSPIGRFFNAITSPFRSLYNMLSPSRASVTSSNAGKILM